MLRYFKFLIRHPSFWYNQILRPSYIYRKNKKQIYNKKDIGK